MRISDRKLFLKYALPCASTLIKRGKLTQEYLDNRISELSSGSEVLDGCEEHFKVALKFCELIAQKMGKTDIDTQVIRQYFLREHDAAVDERYALMKDFDPAACKTRIGEVIAADKTAIVKTSIGLKEYRTDFVSVKQGDRVIVHRNFIIERLDGKLLKEVISIQGGKSWITN